MVDTLLAILSSPAGMLLKPNSPWLGIIEFFPARESFVSDILAGDVEIATLLYSVLVLVIGSSSRQG